jgi:tRNA A-37 threonylcarbamoyl transferase component Bud32
MSHDRLLDLVTVRRLSYEETAAFIGATVGGAVSNEFTDFAYRRAKGSPRLLEALVRSLGGRLELQEEIGAGAMGRVFRAYDSVTKKKVAAKLMLARAGIDLDALLRFQQEGAVLRTMNHPNIVRIYDSFVDEHVSCIVMELLEGESLARTVAERPLDLDRAKTIALQVSDALAYAHSQSIVHRDVKPDNIIVLENDQIKVTDFGIARILSVGTLTGTVATTGMRMGTPLYMAPEQIEGKKVDARSDVYGLGAVLYEMVTGKPLFEGEDALAIAVHQMKDAPAPPGSIRTELPPEWNAVILKALSKDPRRRFQSAKEMKAALEPLRTALTTKPIRPARKRKTAATVAAAFLVLIGSVGAFAASVRHAGNAPLDSYLSGLAAQGNLSGTALVAKQGKVILDRGYGLANRAAHIANGPQIEYGLADTTTTALLAADTLEATQPNTHATLCSQGASIFAGYGCPAKWQNVTVADLVSGASRLPNYQTGRKNELNALPGDSPGWLADTIERTEAGCMSLPLEGRNFPPVHYTSCANLVMALLDPGMWSDWIPPEWHPSGARSHPLLVALLPRLVHLLIPDSPSRDQALDYDSQGVTGVIGSETDAQAFEGYSSAPHLYTADSLLFSNRKAPTALMRLVLAPRGIAAPPDPGINHVQWTDGWKTGYLFGSRVVYTAGSLHNFQTANLRFPNAGVTVIIMTNSASSDALSAAEHAAAFVLPGRQARLAATGPPTVADLMGTYRRQVLPRDAAAVGHAWDQGFFNSLNWPFTGQTLTLTIDRIHFTLGEAESYSATDSGNLFLNGVPPGAPTPRSCESQKTDLAPSGFYHWSLLGRVLTITRVSHDNCADLGTLAAGTWTRTSS